MYTQIMEVVGLSQDEQDETEWRVVGEIDADGIFFAYTQRLDTSGSIWEHRWEEDCTTQYQRDCVAVPNFEHDPDFLYWLRNVAGFTKKGETAAAAAAADESNTRLWKRHESETCLNGCGSR